MYSLPNGLPTGVYIKEGKCLIIPNQPFSNSIILTSRRKSQTLHTESLANTQHHQTQAVIPYHTPGLSHGRIAWRSRELCLGGGVAIFNLASSRVVVCRHTREGHWFLPKGRRDPNEDSRIGAEREGFEEVSHLFRLTTMVFLPPEEHAKYIATPRTDARYLFKRSKSTQNKNKHIQKPFIHIQNHYVIPITRTSK